MNKIGSKDRYLFEGHLAHLNITGLKCCGKFWRTQFILVNNKGEIWNAILDAVQSISYVNRQ